MMFNLLIGVSLRHQFGFKNEHSTELCIYALKEVINYYRNLNSPVFLCFVDIKSAFDRVSYWGLFNKLLDRGVPLSLVLMLEFWFSHQMLFIRWGSVTSHSFNMRNGIRQGSILSPYLFNLYVDDMNKRLNSAGIGCYIGNEAANNFAYADDLVILAPCAAALNDLISICVDFSKDNYIIFSNSELNPLLD